MLCPAGQLRIANMLKKHLDITTLYVKMHSNDILAAFILVKSSVLILDKYLECRYRVYLL